MKEEQQEQTKYFVLDTNVLLHNGRSISSFAGNVVILPMTVIEELDKFKKNNDELGRNARHVIRTLDSLRTLGNLGEGVQMENGGFLKISASREEIPKSALDMNVPDNSIIATAYNLKQQGERTIFVSKDINARLKADALGIEVRDFEEEKADFDTLYTGWREIFVPTETINAYYKAESYQFENESFVPNEFIMLIDDVNPKHTGIGRAVGQNTLKHLSSNYDTAWRIKPHSKEQRMALELLLDPDVDLVTLIGQAGTGKTLLALAAGLSNTLIDQRYEKLLVSRPVIPLGRDIGYLPGSKDEKMKLWMQPIFDNLSYLMSLQHKGREEGETTQQMVTRLIKEEVVELEALTYIRGRSISKQYVVVDEAQNLTPHEVKTIISRVGEGTKMVLTGDPQQIDNPYLDSSSNGLTYTVERLKGREGCGHVTLTRSERSRLSSLAADYL